MGGWKTWTGALMTVAGGVIVYFGFSEIGSMLVTSGVAMMGVGIGHKVEKGLRVISDASKAAADAVASQMPPEAKP